VNRALKYTTKNAVRLIIPLAVRKRLAIWIQHQTWLDAQRRSWWAVEMIRDLADLDANAYHNFLWTHHLAYAAPYEASARFGPDNMRPSRRLFFSDLQICLSNLGVKPEQIASALEVGCSLGYQLRFLETDLFTNAAVLQGIDIDRYAIKAGKKYLANLGSNISLSCGNLGNLEDLIAGRFYDVLICTGVLMYLEENEASDVVRTMLSHSRILVGMAGLAHPNMDNADLDSSAVRDRDQTFIHNFDKMVKKAGGRVLFRRWEADRQLEGQTIYFVFATSHDP
jgi:2-polyprenyl-3-methyl-5-hydroxy-6-metoxy-1,4-benzoquinol methylase